MLVSYDDDPNCQIYDDTKTKVRIIVEFYYNTSDMHIFTTIHLIFKIMRGRAKQKARNLEKK